MAKISILCPTYNHEKYIKYFIDSVLSQTEQDFELIIIDDCSKDNTSQEILKYKDPRITFVKHDYNKGINATLTDLINLAKSDIVTTIASDDMLCKNYIECVLNTFNSNPDVSTVYVSLQYVDEENNEIKNGNVILDENKSQIDIIRDSFFGENPLPSPGMAFKKEAIKDFLPLPFGLIQYSDWQLNNYLLLNTKILVINKCLVNYRITPNSACSRSKKVINREKIETDLLMEPFLNIKDINKFKLIFKDFYEEFGEPTISTIPYFIARLALKSKNIEKQRFGYLLLIKFISKDNNLDLIHNLYGLNYADIINLIEFYNPETEEINQNISHYIKKIKKYKKLSKILGTILLFVIILFLWSLL